MRKWIFSVLLVASVGRADESVSSSATVTPAASTVEHLCRGYFPPNTLWISEFPPGIVAQGISRQEFDSVLDRLQAQYNSDFRRRGVNFVIERNWSSGVVNAYAYRQGFNWIIAMFGGFARFRGITPDGFAAVACHEIGHHLGGAPITDGWASNEGQSDYYSTAKCLKRLFENDDNETILAGRTIDPLAKSRCRAEHRSRQDQNLCIRATMAGLSLAGALASLGGDRVPKLTTPDRTQVAQTDDNHPRAQCRLDTTFQGSLCRESQWSSVSNSDYRVGYCADSRTYSAGLRPRCWFAP